MNKLSITAILLLATCYGVTGAALRQVVLNFSDSVMINDTLITLGDIAEIRSDNEFLRDSLNNFVIGDAAPAGYSRFISRDDLIVYQMQPRFKSVNLVSTGSKRTLISTNYKELSIGQMRDSINRFFNAQLSWPEGSWELEILNGNEKFKVLDKHFSTEFSGLISNSPRGRFSVQMALVQGSRAARISIRCSMKVSAPVVVAIKPILRGEIIAAQNCEIRIMDITRYGIVPCDSLSQVVGKMAMRQILTGTVLTRQWIAQIPEIEKGDPVKIESGRNLIRVAVDAIARESGSAGDKIWVENSLSHKMIKVMVKEKGRATVLGEGG